MEHRTVGRSPDKIDCQTCQGKSSQIGFGTCSTVVPGPVPGRRRQRRLPIEEPVAGRTAGLVAVGSSSERLGIAEHCSCLQSRTECWRHRLWWSVLLVERLARSSVQQVRPVVEGSPRSEILWFPTHFAVRWQSLPSLGVQTAVAVLQCGPRQTRALGRRRLLPWPIGRLRVSSRPCLLAA